MNLQTFQGYPRTIIRGNQVSVYCFFRDPFWMSVRKTLCQWGNTGILIFIGYQYLFSYLPSWQVVVTYAVGGSIGWWIVLIRLGWVKRTFVFTPEIIFYREGALWWQNFKQNLPYGFSLQPHERSQSERFIPGQNQSWYANSFHLVFDHMEQTVWVGDVCGATEAQQITRRLVNVAEYMKEKFPATQSTQEAGSAGQGRQRPSFAGR